MKKEYHSRFPKSRLTPDVEFRLLTAGQALPAFQYKLLKLVEYFENDRRLCFPSQKTLGSWFARSDRYIREQLEKMCRKDLIEVQRRGANKTNIIRFKNLEQVMSEDWEGIKDRWSEIEAEKIRRERRRNNKGRSGTIVPIRIGTQVPEEITFINRRKEGSRR